jgi:ribosomal protein L22
MKVLNCAIANAVNNQELNRQNLYVAEVYAIRAPREALRCPQPRQRVPHAQAHQPHQRGAGPK